MLPNCPVPSLLCELIFVDSGAGQVLRLAHGAAYHTSGAMNQNIVGVPSTAPGMRRENRMGSPACKAQSSSKSTRWLRHSGSARQAHPRCPSIAQQAIQGENVPRNAPPAARRLAQDEPAAAGGNPDFEVFIGCIPDQNRPFRNFNQLLLVLTNIPC